jgi:hypothetical protein
LVLLILGYGFPIAHFGEKCFRLECGLSTLLHEEVLFPGRSQDHVRESGIDSGNHTAIPTPEINILAGVTLTHVTLCRCRNVFNNLEKPSHTASALFTLTCTARLPIANTSRIELFARIVVNLRLQPPHASLIGGDRRSSSGNSAKFTAICRASSRVSRLGRRAMRRSDMCGIGREAEARGLL